MKVTIQPSVQEFELNEEQVARLKEIGQGKNYYWTNGDDGDRLDELSKMGLVYGGCGGGSDEIYRLTEKGQLVYEKIR